MWIIQAERHRRHFYVAENDKLTLDIWKAVQFINEEKALKHIEWEGPIGKSHPTIKVGDNSYLRNKHSSHTFKPVNISMAFPNFTKQSLQPFINSYNWLNSGYESIAIGGQHKITYG